MNGAAAGARFRYSSSSGAARFLKANDSNAATSAAAVAPSAARSNRSIFFAADGRARSVGEVLERFAAKLGTTSPAGKTLPPAGTALPVAVAAAATVALPLTTRDLNQRQLASMLAPRLDRQA